jgi:hypothetical protein
MTEASRTSLTIAMNKLTIAELLKSISFALKRHSLNRIQFCRPLSFTRADWSGGIYVGYKVAFVKLGRQLPVKYGIGII